MVVPIMSEKPKTKRIVGDGKKIMLRTNSDSLLVIGSGNSVTVDNNEGSIKVIGDGCTVSVGKGFGKIEYKGDGGYLETGSDLSNIKYRGDGGKIVQLNKESKKNGETSKDKKHRHTVANINVSSTRKCHISTNPTTIVQIPRITVPAIGFVINNKHQW